MMVHDSQDCVINNFIASTLLSLGSLFLEEASRRVVRTVKQPYERSLQGEELKCHANHQHKWGSHASEPSGGSPRPPSDCSMVRDRDPEPRKSLLNSSSKGVYEIATFYCIPTSHVGGPLSHTSRCL